MHLAGFLANSCDGGVASYWKDTVYTALESSRSCSMVSSLYVDGSKVFIGGSKYDAGSPSKALIWEDGTGSVIDGVFGRPMIASRNNNLFGVWFEEDQGGFSI